MRALQVACVAGLVYCACCGFAILRVSTSGGANGQLVPMGFLRTMHQRAGRKMLHLRLVSSIGGCYSAMPHVISGLPTWMPTQSRSPNVVPYVFPAPRTWLPLHLGIVPPLSRSCLAKLGCWGGVRLRPPTFCLWHKTPDTRGREWLQVGGLVVFADRQLQPHAPVFAVL